MSNTPEGMANAAPFGDVSAELYNIFYADKNYAGEAEWVTQLIGAHAPQATTMLDVACGTGLHLHYLQHAFAELAGIDLSRAQIARARQFLPVNVDLHVGDIRHFDLRRRFGAVACLFKSISYLATLDDLHQGIKNMTRHVQPGGLVIIEPGLSPDEYTSLADTIGQTTVEGPAGQVVSRLSVRGPMPSTGEGLVDVNMYYTFGRRNSGGEIVVDTLTEHHRLGIFAVRTYIQAMERARVTDVWAEEPPAFVGQYGRQLIVGKVQAS